jgi:hypothetical protein
MLFNGGAENHGDNGLLGYVFRWISPLILFSSILARAHLLPPRTREKGEAYTAIQHLMYFFDILYYMVGLYYTFFDLFLYVCWDLDGYPMNI